MRVKSQCILLRASVDEFEKSKKQNGGTTNQRFPDEIILRMLDSTRPTRNDMNKDDGQLKFYQMIVDELEFDRCSIAVSDPNTMQQD